MTDQMQLHPARGNSFRAVSHGETSTTAFDQKSLVPLMIRKYAPCLVVLLLLPLGLRAETVTPLRDGWRLQSACKLEADGAAIAADGFATEGWLKTTVPSTVLAAQAAAGVIPDPYFGDNLRKIPGTTYPIGQLFSNMPMAPDSPYHCGWWYRTEFTAPAMTAQDGRFWLHFGGINYRAEIWVNGHKIADEQKVAGAYRTYDFDVTDASETRQDQCACRGNFCAHRERPWHQLGRLESLPAG